MKNTNRLIQLDLLRGLLMVFMILSHAYGLLPSDPTLADLWLPRGWATTSFVMLSGLTIGWLYYPQAKKNEAQRLLRRSKEIFLVAVFSNIFFILMRLVIIEGSIETAYNTTFWLDMMLLKDHWSISGVLIPTSLLLALLSQSLTASRKLSPIHLLLGATGLKVLISCLGVLGSSYNEHHLADLLFFGGMPQGFVILPLIVNGLWGFAFGTCMATSKKQGHQWMLGILVCYGLSLLSWPQPFAMQHKLWVEIFTSLGRFILLYLCVEALCQIKTERLSAIAQSILAPLGHYGLFVFLLHRPVLQFLSRGFSFISLPTITLTAVFLSSLVIIRLSLSIRQRTPIIDGWLRKLLYI